MRISSKRATDAKNQIRKLNKAREQIGIYLQSCVRTLERESGRIATGFLKNLLFQTKISRFRVTTSMELSFRGAHWIELVEFYLENEWESWKAFMGESPQFFTKFDVFL